MGSKSYKFAASIISNFWLVQSLHIKVHAVADQLDRGILCPLAQGEGVGAVLLRLPHVPRHNIHGLNALGTQGFDSIHITWKKNENISPFISPQLWLLCRFTQQVHWVAPFVDNFLQPRDNILIMSRDTATFTLCSIFYFCHFCVACFHCSHLCISRFYWGALVRDQCGAVLQEVIVRTKVSSWSFSFAPSKGCHVTTLRKA